MSHQPGTQLDALIHAKLLRFSERGVPPGFKRTPRDEAPVPRYSTDIAAAWQLIGWMQIMQFTVAVMTTAQDRAHLGGWTCAVNNGTIGMKSAGATAELAISRAMLAILIELEHDHSG